MAGWIRFRVITAGAFVTAIALLGFAAKVWGQSSPKLHADSIRLQVVSTHQDPDDPKDLIVTVRVTIRAAGQPLVIPNCPASNVGARHFCMASLRRRDGRPIGVRKGLAATLGVENPDRWKAVTIEPEAEDSFLFSFSTGLLDVKFGEPVRVGFEVWPNANSVKDWKSGTILVSPIFRCPPKED